MLDDGWHRHAHLHSILVSCVMLWLVDDAVHPGMTVIMLTDCAETFTLGIGAQVHGYVLSWIVGFVTCESIPSFNFVQK